MLKLTSKDREQGSAAILVAGALVLLLGMAAVAIDVGAGFNERRQDQTAADVGLMSASVDVFFGTDAMRDAALEIARLNLDQSYAEQEWQTMWASCSDSERAVLNSNGFDLIPLDAPSSWTFVPANTTLDCLSWDPAGFLRMRVPNQEVNTTFGRVIGVDALTTSASAIVEFPVRSGAGGILPFGVLGGAGGGDYVCLRDNSGQPPPPCGEDDSGNFGTIDVPIFEYTNGDCYEANKNIIRAVNIANGVDHLLIPYTNAAAPSSFPDDTLDTCANLEDAEIPDTVDTFTGLAGGFAEGLATGGNPLPAGYTPRLQQSSNTRAVHGHPLDDTPLWDLLLPDGSTAWDDSADDLTTLEYGVNAPMVCDPDSFSGSGDTGNDFDEDGELDLNGSWQHMWQCLDEYEDGGFDVQIFDELIAEETRFAYIPQFWEDDWPNGVSQPRHIERFLTTWLQGTFWKQGSNNDLNPFHPDEAGTFSGNAQLRMLTGFVLPDATLPVDLRGDPPPFGGVSLFDPTLFS